MKWRAALDRALATLLVVLMALMVVNVLWQVASRYLMRNPSTFTDELSRFLLIWTGLLGAAYATSRRLHLAIDLLPSRARPPHRRWYQVFIASMGAFFGLVMALGGSWLVYTVSYLGQTSAALGLPMGGVYAALPLSGLLIAYYSLDNLWQDLRSTEAPAASPSLPTKSAKTN